MARRFAKVSEEEIEEAFFYPSDLVNTKTTILLRVGEERWIYTETRSVEVYIHRSSPTPFFTALFTSPSGDSCIIFYIIFFHSNCYKHEKSMEKIARTRSDSFCFSLVEKLARNFKPVYQRSNRVIRFYSHLKTALLDLNLLFSET